MLISAVQKNESAVCVHISPPSGPPSHHLHPSLWVITEPWAELPVLCSSFPRAVSFIHCSVYISALLSQFAFPSPSFPRSVRKSIIFIFVSISAPQIGSSVPFFSIPCMRAKSLQLCLTLCDPTDYSLPGLSSVHGILQARKLNWATEPASRGSSWPRDRTGTSCVGARCLPLSHRGSTSRSHIYTFSPIPQVCPALRPHGPQHARLTCPSPTPRACLNSCPLSWWCHPTILSSVVPFSCPQSFPVSGSFPVSHFFTSGGESTGASASASVLLMNIQDWSPLGWTGLISLQSKGLSRVLYIYTLIYDILFFLT